MAKYDRTQGIVDAQNRRKKGRYADKQFILDVAKMEELGLEMLKVEEGDVFLRFIPLPSNDFFGKEVKVHYNVGADDSEFLCPRTMRFGECPICEQWDIAQKKDDDWKKENQEYIRTLSYSTRRLFFVIDAANKKSIAEGVKVYNAPVSIEDGIYSVSRNRRSGKVIDISNETDGRILAFTRTGKMLKSKYTGFELEDDPFPVEDEWLDSVVDWDELLIKADYDTIYKAFNIKSKQELEDDDEDEDEPPRKKRQSIPEDDDDDEPLRKKRREVEEEPEEDEPPRKKRREEPEDDEPPRKKRREEPEEEGEDETDSRSKVRERLRKLKEKREREGEDDAEEKSSPKRRRRSE